MRPRMPCLSRAAERPARPALDSLTTSNSVFISLCYCNPSLYWFYPQPEGARHLAQSSGTEVGGYRQISRGAEEVLHIMEIVSGAARGRAAGEWGPRSVATDAAIHPSYVHWRCTLCSQMQCGATEGSRCRGKHTATVP